MTDRQRTYFCTVCGRTPNGSMTEQRDGLTAKRVQFVEMGEGGRTVRSRVVAWLCEGCLALDLDFNRPERRGSGAPDKQPRRLH